MFFLFFLRGCWQSGIWLVKLMITICIHFLCCKTLPQIQWLKRRYICCFTVSAESRMFQLGSLRFGVSPGCTQGIGQGWVLEASLENRLTQVGSRIHFVAAIEMRASVFCWLLAVGYPQPLEVAHNLVLSISSSQHSRSFSKCSQRAITGVILKSHWEKIVVSYRKLKNSCNTNPLLKVNLWYPSIHPTLKSGQNDF